MAGRTQRVCKRCREEPPMIGSDNWAHIPAGDRWRKGRTQGGLFKQQQPSEIKQGAKRLCAREVPHYSLVCC